jgi:hypothetical protein
VSGVPGYEEVGFSRDGEIDERLIAGVPWQREYVRRMINRDGESLKVAKEGLDAREGQIGVAGGELGAEWNITQFSQKWIAYEQNKFREFETFNTGGGRSAAADQGLDEDNCVENNPGRGLAHADFFCRSAR